jgi:hypothetical protein
MDKASHCLVQLQECISKAGGLLPEADRRARSTSEASVSGVIVCAESNRRKVRVFAISWGRFIVGILRKDREKRKASALTMETPQKSPSSSSNLQK